MWVRAFILIGTLYTKYVSSIHNSMFNETLAKNTVLQVGSLPDTHGIAAVQNTQPALLTKAGHTYTSNYGYDRTVSLNNNHHSSFLGPTALLRVLHKGHIGGTPEVTTARFGSSPALPNSNSYGGSGNDYDYKGETPQYLNYREDYTQPYVGSYDNHGDFRYHGPIAIPYILPDGHIADTPEVAAARAKHFQAVSEAKLHTTYGNENDYENEEHYPIGVSIKVYQNHHSHQHYGFSGINEGFPHQVSTSIPGVLHDGHISNTPWMATAKAYHYAALSKAKAHEYESSGSLASDGDHNENDGGGPFPQAVVWKSG